MEEVGGVAAGHGDEPAGGAVQEERAVLGGRRVLGRRSPVGDDLAAASAEVSRAPTAGGRGGGGDAHGRVWARQAVAERLGEQTLRDRSGGSSNPRIQPSVSNGARPSPRSEGPRGRGLQLPASTPRPAGSREYLVRPEGATSRPSLEARPTRSFHPERSVPKSPAWPPHSAWSPPPQPTPSRESPRLPPGWPRLRESGFATPSCSCSSLAFRWRGRGIPSSSGSRCSRSRCCS